jgi:sulfopyruvate decarboxylase beta subunit
VPRPEEELLAILKKNGVDFTASLPCEKIKTLLEMVSHDFQHVPLTREEEGVGICAGAALAGRRPAMFVQSSGIGNMINALLSLTQFYELPLALFVSRRGVYQEKIAAQFPMGVKLPGMLSGAGIEWTEIDSAEDIKKIDRILSGAYANNAIHAFLMSPKAWEGSECKAPDRASAHVCGGWEGTEATQNATLPSLTRYEIISLLEPYLEGKIVVSNLGWPSKELYALKHQPSNFYMLGSMGMATPIGLGIALSTSKDVVVIDGDGSILMNSGTLATAAAQAPKNLTILCIDNGAYGSTGNQPTLAGVCTDLEAVARGFGFVNTVKLAKEIEFAELLKDRRRGLRFIHALGVPGNKDVPNIPVNHLEIKKQVMGVLKGR